MGFIPIQLSSRRRKSNVGLYSAIAVAILLSIGLLAYATLESNNISSASFATVETGFPVYGALNLNSLNFKVPGNHVEIKLSQSSGTFKVNELSLDLHENADIILLDYEGSLEYDSNAKLDGCATSALIGNMIIAKNGKCIDIEVDTTFEYIRITDISLKSFNFKSTGRIDAANKGSFTINDEEVELKPFNGDIELRGSQITISGDTRKLLVDGMPRLSVE